MSNRMRALRRRPTRCFLPGVVAIAASLALLVCCASAAAAAPPSIESESASNITHTDATLEAQIDPGGLETTYEVMLEAPSCQSVNPPGSCEASGGVEIASGTIPTGASAETVSVDIAHAWGHSLSPSTSYAYFFRAVNSAGEAFGAQREFETPAASPPTIESESVSSITSDRCDAGSRDQPARSPRGRLLPIPARHRPERIRLGNPLSADTPTRNRWLHRPPGVRCPADRLPPRQHPAAQRDFPRQPRPRQRRRDPSARHDLPLPGSHGQGRPDRRHDRMGSPDRSRCRSDVHDAVGPATPEFTDRCRHECPIADNSVGALAFVAASP